MKRSKKTSTAKTQIILIWLALWCKCIDYCSIIGRAVLFVVIVVTFPIYMKLIQMSRQQKLPRKHIEHDNKIKRTTDHSAFNLSYLSDKNRKAICRCTYKIYNMYTHTGTLGGHSTISTKSIQLMLGLCHTACVRLSVLVFLFSIHPSRVKQMKQFEFFLVQEL